MDIACPTEWTYGAVIDLGFKVTYHGEVAPADAEGGQQRFETDTCDDQREGIRLYQLLRGSDSAAENKWKWCGPDDGFGTGRGMLEGPNQPVYVGAEEGAPCSDRFASLLPIESWTASPRRVQSGTS